MHGKQGVILYLKQWASQHGSLSGHCFQLAKSAGISEKEFQQAVRSGLEMYEARKRTELHRHAA